MALLENFTLPGGVWPTMITPFNEDGCIDFECLNGLVEFYISNGVSGLFTVCLSSEMYQLNDEERLQLARHVKEQAMQRVPVVAAGTFGGTIEEMAVFVKQMSTIVDAVVVLTNQMAEKDDDDTVLERNLNTLLELTPGVPLGLYECPVPYPRHLSPATLRWAASSGRFFFHKDTECRKSALAAKIHAVKSVPSSPFRFFNADVVTLKYSLEQGASGFSGISANVYPHLLVWLCQHFKDEKKNAVIAQNFLGTAESLVSWKYPASAKLYHKLHGRQISCFCRIGTFSFNDLERTALTQLNALLKSTCRQIGISSAESNEKS